MFTVMAKDERTASVALRAPTTRHAITPKISSTRAMLTTEVVWEARVDMWFERLVVLSFIIFVLSFITQS